MVKDQPITPDAGAVHFSAVTSPMVKGDDETIVESLTSYFNEADMARKGGLNPRDEKWEENLALYWGRHDFSNKASWQAREVMPEVPEYVDRFAASMKEALIATPDGFFNIIDPADQEADIGDAIRRMTSVWLSRAGRNQMGQLLPFSSVFEEQMKLGALMTTASVVTWKGDVPDGRVAIETVDPRFVWLDPTYRNLYRIRRIELDRHDLVSMAKAKDGSGHSIYNLPQLEQLVHSLNEDQARKEEMSGHGHNISSGRSPITLDEYIATVVDAQGNVIADRALMVVANQRYLIRGPEKNPFLHGSDWLITAPLVTTPLSVYGRSYMEDFGDVAHTYTELTNLLLDAVFMSSLKAFAVVPSLLANPEQLAEGITANKMFFLEEGVKPDQFWDAVDMGTLPPEAMTMWQAIKKELSEAARINEIGIGQFAPKGRTSATEINETQQSSSALLRGIAQTVETRYLDPTLDLTWKTGLQHAKVTDTLLASAAGKDLFAALMGRRKELIKRPITFQARGISNTLRKSQMLKSLIGLMQMVASSEVMLQQFFTVVSPERLMKKLFELSDIDLFSLQLTEREKMIQSVMQPLNAAQEKAGPPGGQPGQGAQEAARTMGL